MVEEKITEAQLEALYLYLSLHFDTSNNEEKLFWIELMQKLDNEFEETI